MDRDDARPASGTASVLVGSEVRSKDPRCGTGASTDPRRTNISGTPAPRISATICTHNRAEYLGKALKSLSVQTLPERLTLAREQKMPHHDLLLQVLSDEVTRR
ncbi:MAG TPA: glycosyltransferase, partial [Gemmatimonadales bacterium]|nr:glycosyltransferase [Gemmatimonadales bacterium]